MSKLTARELLEQIPHKYQIGPAETLGARVEKVLALHKSEEHFWKGQKCSADTCSECGCDVRCPTVRLLDGEDE